MIKLSSFKLLALVSIILSIGIVTSCNKDDEEVTSDKIQLLSFGPTGAKHGDTILFIGNKLDKVTAIQFTGTNATVNQADFKKQSSRLIALLVPPAAEKGYVTLKTPEGDIVSKTQFNLDVLTGVTSITAQARPGQNVTITGTYLNWVDRVTFSKDKTVTVFVSKTQTQLVVKIPDDAETGPLILHYTGTDSNFVQTADTLKVTLPLTTTMSPNPVKPLTDLTITGTDLDLTKKIIFTGVSSPVTTFVSQSATQIVVTVPNGVTNGKITLGVLNSTLTVLSDDILQINGAVPPPTIALPIYDDAVTSNWTSTGWIGGGWGGTSDYNNTAPVRAGAKSVKINYVGGWGAPLQLGGASLNVSAYTTFKISVYGGPGTAGKKVNVGINGADAYTITLVEGSWTDYAVPISSLTASTTITDIIVKEFNGTGGFTIYVDALGFN